MFSLEAVLALFVLLAISTVVYFIAEKIRLPYTVLLVATGLLLVPLAEVGPFEFLHAFELTPSLLFYIFLPLLIFESAYNMNIRKMTESAVSISALAVISLLISTFFVAAALWWLFGMLGYAVPFMLSLLFGALISSTDPVAVLALFKEYGAPRRLSLIFEGESLFNDGTAVATFLVILEIALKGFHGASTIIEAVVMLIIMVIGGSLFGLFTGTLAAKLIGKARSSEAISISIILVTAHLTFILSEIISEHVMLGGFELRLSSIIATTVASMVIGNYGRAKLPHGAGEFIERFFGQFAFLANSIVFLLLGLLFVNTDIVLSAFMLPIITTVLIVALGRAVSVYPVIALVNSLKLEPHIPRSWSHLLAWGSLRGALAVTLALIIPDGLSFEGWKLAATPKEFILALTVSCIYATLFIKATTIGAFMRRMKITDLTVTEKQEAEDARALVHAKILHELADITSKGYTDEELAAKLTEEHRAHLTERYAEESPKSNDPTLPLRVLHIYAIGIEKHYLERLYQYGEVNEDVYRRIQSKLDIQLEHYEAGRTEKVDPSKHDDRHDVFEHLRNVYHRWFGKKSEEQELENSYLYYRAQSIIARKVQAELEALHAATADGVFDNDSFRQVIAHYSTYRTNAGEKMKAVRDMYPDLAKNIEAALAQCASNIVTHETLLDLKHKGMLTPKLYIELVKELESA